MNSVTHDRRRYVERWMEIAAPTGLTLVWLVPFLLLIVGSLLELDAARPSTFYNWVGVEHYVEAIQTNNFWWALWRTTGLTLGVVVFALPLGALMSWSLLGLNERAARIVLAIVMLPLFLPPITTALVWYFQLNPQYGPVGYTAYKFLGYSLLNADTAFKTLVAVEIWRLTPMFVVLFYLAGKSLEQSLSDTIKVYRPKVSFALLGLLLRRFRSVIGLAFLLGLAIASRSFESIFVITGGGPGTITQTMPILIHRLSFQRFEIGMGATVSIVYNILLVVVFLQLARRMDFE